MKVSGKYPVKRLGIFTVLLAAAVVGVLMINTYVNDDPEADGSFYEDSAVIPDDAVYLGTSMGGYFVSLKRRDITLDDGQIVPAFEIDMYHAWANNRDYGEERVGDLAYRGQALWVPSDKMVEDASGAPIEPPSVQQILVNEGRWVNFNVLHVRMKPAQSDPEDEYVAQIVPL